jgi:hypothetical protein
MIDSNLNIVKQDYLMQHDKAFFTVLQTQFNIFEIIRSILLCTIK